MLSEILDLLLLPLALMLRRMPRHSLSELEPKAFEWKRLRYAALARHGRRCLYCGASPTNGTRIVVYHIKPARIHPRLRLRLDNLQILCADCNVVKGSNDRKD